MKLNDFCQPGSAKDSRKAISESSRAKIKKTQPLHEACHDMESGPEHLDHEVNMAKADLYKLSNYSAKLHDMLQDVSEREGIEGWQQAKITKAADYISAVYHSLDYDQKFEEAKATKTRLDPSCWAGKKIGNPKTKVKGGVRVNNCVPEGLDEADMRDPAWVGLSGEDYEDMMSGRRRSRGEPDDSPRDPNDYSDLSKEVQYEIEAEKRRKKHEEKFKTEKDWQEGDAPNGKEYNLRYVVTSDDPEIIKNELYKFQNSHDYYMRKLVDTEIRPGQGIGYYMDVNSWNHPVKPRKSAQESAQDAAWNKKVKKEGIEDRQDHNDKIYAQMHAIAQNIGDREEVAAERRRKIFHPEEFADQVRFSVNSEKAQHAIMSRYGEFISQDEEGHFVAPRKIWSKIEQTAYDADGEGAEEIYDEESMSAMKNESSDPSGVFHAAKHLNKSFLVKAEMAQGGTKTFRVKAQSERVAREKFSQHHAQAKVLSVKEEQGMAEGYWQYAVKKAEAEREARKGKPSEKNPASHDKQGVYKGDKDLAGNPVPKRKEQGMAEGHADQQRKIFKKNGKPVGEVGIDRESSPGVGQWYMKCYLNGIDNAGYDSYEEAVAELKHCLKQGMVEGQQVNEESRDVYKDYIAMGHSHAEAMRAAREYEDKQKSRDYQDYVTKIYINDKYWQKGDNNILGERGAQKAAQHAANIARKTGKRVSIHMLDIVSGDTLAIADFDNGKWKYRDLTASATESVTEDSADRTVHISKDDWTAFEDWMESEGLGISEEDGITHNDLGDVIELVFPPANTSWNNDAAWMYASEWDVRDQNMQEDSVKKLHELEDPRRRSGVIPRRDTPKFAAINTQTTDLVDVNKIHTSEEWHNAWRAVNRASLDDPSGRDRMLTIRVQRTKGSLMRRAEEINREAGKTIVKVPGLSEGRIKDIATHPLYIKLGTAVSQYNKNLMDADALGKLTQKYAQKIAQDAGMPEQAVLKLLADYVVHNIRDLASESLRENTGNKVKAFLAAVGLAGAMYGLDTMHIRHTPVYAEIQQVAQQDPDPERRAQAERDLDALNVSMDDGKDITRVLRRYGYKTPETKLNAINSQR